MSLTLRKGMTILFQGDSITDSGRRNGVGEGLGTGYAYMVATRLTARYPELGLKLLNRGVSGDRTRDLVARWDRDCLSLKPDLVSILIGVNNTWRRYDRNDPTPVELFYDEYRSILSKTREMVGENLVVCEPFLLPCPEDRKQWREDLDPKIRAVRDLAAEFGATYVPFDGVFAAASTRVDPEYWAPDGVHPTPAGHALMADAWERWVVG